MITRPSSLSCANASRTGDLDTPSSSEMLLSDNVFPIGSVPSMMELRKCSRARSFNDFVLLKPFE